jgi:hypothetical protein
MQSTTQWDWIFTGEDHKENWLYNRYYCGGGNSRYSTFQLAINLLLQRDIPQGRPLILETGCQRQEDDIGAGMSTSIFAEFVHRAGGHLISVDNNLMHLHICSECIAPWKDSVDLVCADSIQYLSTYQGPLDLVYLDSLDYPVGNDAGNLTMQRSAQEHNLAELQAIYSQLTDMTIVLLDDNTLPKGGKTALTKSYLIQNGWKCLLDHQQSLWVRRI